MKNLCVCVSGCKKCSFFGKFGVLCFFETPVLSFTLLPYYRRYDHCDYDFHYFPCYMITAEFGFRIVVLDIKFYLFMVNQICTKFHNVITLIIAYSQNILRTFFRLDIQNMYICHHRNYSDILILGQLISTIFKLHTISIGKFQRWLLVPIIFNGPITWDFQPRHVGSEFKLG